MAFLLSSQPYTKRTVPAESAGLRGLLSFLATELGNIQRGMSRATSRSVTADTTATAGDGLILVDTTAGVVTVTLPDPNKNADMMVTIKRISGGANAVTIAGGVDGTTNPTLGSQWAAKTVWAHVPSPGTGAWYTVASV